MPTQDNKPGVSQVTVDSNHEGQRVDNFLSARLKGVPRSHVYRLIRTGQVRINGRRCKPTSRLHEGDRLRIPPVRIGGAGEVTVPDSVTDLLRERILYRDDELLVLDKPAGMAVHAGSGLSWGAIDALRRLFEGEYLELAHRLDRETSGCLLVARNGASLQRLSAQFRNGEIDKRYLCLLAGPMGEDLVEVDAPLLRLPEGQQRMVQAHPEGKPARTRFRRLQGFRDATYCEAALFTGRTHQIRVHALQLGYALAGDRRYGDRDSIRHWRGRGLKRVFLHAHYLRLETGRGEQEFNAPLPEDLRAVLDGLEQGNDGRL